MENVCQVIHKGKELFNLLDTKELDSQCLVTKSLRFGHKVIRMHTKGTQVKMTMSEQAVSNA